MTNTPSQLTPPKICFDTLWCLFCHGATWDGDMPSKTGRDEMVRLGLVERHEGWQWLTWNGHVAAIDAGLGDRKEKWQRQQRESRQ